MTIPNVVFKIGMPTLVCSRDAEGRPRIEGIASSTVVDGHGDEITVTAQRKMVASAQGMTIFLNHEYRVPEDVFGTVTKASLVSTDLTDKKTGKPIYDMRLGIDVADSNPRAMSTWELLATNKSKLGISVGAMIPEGGATFNKDRNGLVIDDIDLMEASLVGVPASPRSFVDYAVKSLTGRFPEKLDRQSFLAKVASDMAGEEVAETPDEDEEDAVEAVSKALDEIASVGEAVAAASPDEDPEPDESTPDTTTVEKTKVSIWETDEGKTIEVDTGRNKPKSDGSHSEQDEPESSGGSSTSKAGEGPTVLTTATAALDNSGAIIASLSAQLRASRAETAEVKEQLKQITELSTKAIQNAASVVEKVGKLPAGRSTGYVEVKDAAAELSSVYGEDVRKILRTAITQRSN